MNQVAKLIHFLPRTLVPAAGTHTFATMLSEDVILGGGDAGPVTPANQRLAKYPGIRAMGLRCHFEYGAAGTSAKLFLQSSFDNVLWHDVACFAFLLASASKVAFLNPVALVPTVATDGTLADDTIGGPPAIFWRIKAIIAGAYTTTFMSLRGEPLA